MASDNEVMVLIYETVQKQLNQIKDSRIVVQSLANRTAEIESAVKAMAECTEAITERLGALESAVEKLTSKTDSSLAEVNTTDMKLKDNVTAMRATLDNVTNPSISLISKNHGEIKDAVRELGNVHKQVMDEFERYEVRLLKLEDNIDKLFKRQVLIAEPEENDD